MDKALTVVIPAFNEEKAIGQVLADLAENCSHFVQRIIVVDDGSTDETAAIAQSAGAELLHHRRNLGYGESLKSGIRAAETPYVLTMDSDGQHRSQDVVRLWEASATDADLIIGQRTRLLHSPLWRMPGKWLLTRMAQYLTRTKIPDLNSGMRLFRREVILKYLHLCPRGFSFSTTSTMALLNRGYDVRFVPIEVTKRIGKSAVRISTGLSTIILVIRISALFDPLRIFLPASFVAGTLGVAWGLPYALSERGLSVGSLLLIVTAILLFAIGLLADQISQLRLERYE